MKISIDKNITYQTFEGFGASGAWWAQEVGGWDCRDEISSLLFSKEKGIGLRTYRYNLGAGSVSGRGNIENPLRRTQAFETAPDVYDFTRDENAVYMMRRAVRDGAEEVILFVNSPLERLTKNHKAHCEKSKPFQSNLAKENILPFAKYCLDVTEHFVSEGLPVRYLSPVNEPFWVWNGGQEGCHYSPKRAGQVMKTFAQEMEKRPLLRGVKLSGVENGDIRWFNKSYTRCLLKDECVRKRLDSVDLHSYFLNPFPFSLPVFSNRIGYLKRYRRWMDRHYPGVPVKMSEWTHMQSGRDKGMASALVMANVIYEDLSLLNVTSWQHWIAVSEVDYCDGLIYIDLADKHYELTKRYYATGNFSKYIPYGAVRVAARADGGALKLLAFAKEDTTVLILINDSGTPQEVTLPCRHALLAVTDEANNLTQRPVGQELTLTAHSVNTVIF